MRTRHTRIATIRKQLSRNAMRNAFSLFNSILFHHHLMPFAKCTNWKHLIKFQQHFAVDDVCGASECENFQPKTINNWSIKWWARDFRDFAFCHSFRWLLLLFAHSRWPHSSSIFRKVANASSEFMQWMQWRWRRWRHRQHWWWWNALLFYSVFLLLAFCLLFVFLNFCLSRHTICASI